MISMPKILVVEDEDSIRMALEDDLTLEGFQIAGAADGEQGLQMAKENNYDLIVLDIMLPKMSGFDVCKELRKANITTPIIMLTAKSQEIDKILGLELGADDYVTKPFSPRELLARIKAILRRSDRIEQDMDIFNFGEIELNFKTYQAKKDEEPIYLTALEYALLQFFIKHKNEVLSRDQILDEIWGTDVYVTHRTVDTHVANLRRKLEDEPSNPKYFLGVRGVGYRFTIDD
jgi:two-component system alkaline phosphatase synthesis response regulator PhoP